MYFLSSGQRVHSTEMGSRSSFNSQLASSVREPRDFIIQEFCIKVDYGYGQNSVFFRPGSLFVKLFDDCHHAILITKNVFMGY